MDIQLLLGNMCGYYYSTTIGKFVDIQVLTEPVKLLKTLVIPQFGPRLKPVNMLHSLCSLPLNKLPLLIRGLAPATLVMMMISTTPVKITFFFSYNKINIF